MKQLYFVRHGESVLNLRRIFAGQTDTPLTDKGREQARAAGKQARTISFDLIVSSPLSRALETAQIIADEIGYSKDNILVSDIFLERSLGILEGKSWDEFDEPHEHDDESGAANGIETDAQLLARAQKGLEFLQSLPQETILLVGHGSFSRELRAAIDPNQTYGEPENAEIVQLI